MCCEIHSYSTAFCKAFWLKGLPSEKLNVIHLAFLARPAQVALNGLRIAFDGRLNRDSWLTPFELDCDCVLPSSRRAR
jgi:hypothetical protein